MSSELQPTETPRLRECGTQYVLLCGTLMLVLRMQILVYSLRVTHCSALNDRLEAATNHALAVEWHGVSLGLHAGIGHDLVPSRLAPLL